MKKPQHTTQAATSWDERYRLAGFLYGTEPNDFLRETVERIPAGRVLMLGEGEGRNAVFLASLGYQVTAVDSSSIGLAKARQLADERGVSITTIAADLRDFRIENDVWDGIVSSFCHLPADLRKTLHRSVVQGLKPNGALVLEGFSKAQLSYGTGGPPLLDLLYDLDELRNELFSLDFAHALTREREVREGSGHTGLSSVVQILAFKPVPR